MSQSTNHSKKLLHLAEYLIPLETMNFLSALELAILIMSFYLHDLGLCITQTEKERIIKSEEFNSFILLLSFFYLIM